MKKVALQDVKPSSAPKRFNMCALKLHGREETGAQKFWMGLSYFLPQGGSEYEASPTEKIHFVHEGEVAAVTEKETILLKKWDSIHIGANECRLIIKESNQPASMLVGVNY